MRTSKRQIYVCTKNSCVLRWFYLFAFICLTCFINLGSVSCFTVENIIGLALFLEEYFD